MCGEKKMKADKLLAVTFLILVTVSTSGQTNPNTDQGMKPYDSFHGGALDSISLTSGNLIVHAPLYSSAQRGKLQFAPFVLYNNKGFVLTETCPGKPAPCTFIWRFKGAGVSIFVAGDPQSAIGVKQQRVDTGATDGNGNELWTTIYTATTIDGAMHQLADTGNGYRSIDGSGILWNSSTNIATDRSGMSYGALKAEDPNGNFVSYNVNATWTDTLGRTLPTPGNATATSVSNCPQLNLPYQVVTAAYLWTLPGPSSTGTSQFTLCYTTVAIHTAYFGAACGNAQLKEVCYSYSMLQSVVLPNGTAWTFEYDGANPNDLTTVGYGDLLRVGFPTGGSLSYTYTTDIPYQGQYQPDMVTTQSRSVVSRTIDANDGTGPHTTSYKWGNITANTATAYAIEKIVTDALGDDTVHVISGLFGGPSLYETQTRTYQGSEGAGTLLKTVNTDYSYSSNPFDNLGPNANPPTAINVMPSRVTTIWPNGQTSKAETDYDSGFIFRDPTWGLPVFPPPGNTTKTYSGTLGSATAHREYDYGSGGAGNLLSETFTTYLWQNNGNYLSGNLLDLPVSITHCSPLGSGESADAAGCSDSNFTLKRRSQTVSGYDDPARLFGASISTQHEAPRLGVRGNLTSVARWLNTSGCDPQTPGSCPTAYTNWYDTGEVYQSIDPLGHTTTHSYDPTYAGAYPTQTCNALNQCITGAYDTNSGLITSFTDANSQTDTYAYDSSWRITSAIFPADSSGNHPETDFNYPNATTVQRSKKQSVGANPPSSTSWIVDYAYFDGVGRTTQTRLVDPAGDDFVDTSYDALGRVNTVSNPHRSTSSATDGVTTPSYDALGRVTQTTAQDGSISKTDYSNFPTVTVTDPAGKMRRIRSDALGRLVEVDEPGPGANTGGSPGTGSINVSGSLYSSTSSGSYATGSVTVSGALQSFYVEVCNDTCIRQRKTDPGGTVTVTVNGHPDQVTYGSSASSIASNLITTINNDGGAFVWASGPSCADNNDCTISLQARTPGPNYSLSMQGQSNDEADGFTSFDASYASGSTLTGGVYPVTTYDSGTVTVTVSGSQISTFQASAPYNQNLNTTASAITNALISSLNGPGSPVNASLSGTTTILLSAKGVGTATDLTVTGSSTASFTASSTTLSNGTNPGGLYAPYVTTYSYDPLGNLLQVNQSGDGSQAARVRSFTYDSFSNLLTASNPESGKITYTYDADGNLVSKTSPQANQTGSATTTVTYCYDPLNRIAAKQYTNSGVTLPTCASTPPYLPSPAVTYTYDSGTNAIGHLSSLTDQAGSGSYTFDPLGRTSGEQRTTNGVTRSTSYLYNLDSSLQSVTYPGPSFTVSYTYDTAGRPTSVADSGGFTYASRQTTDSLPTGAFKQFETPNFNYQFTYNNRLQPTEISAGNTTVTLFDKKYGYNSGANNGNVMSITNVNDSTRSQTFAYDQLNRLTSASDASHWGNNYVYDAWGNLLQKSPLSGKPVGENLGVTADVYNRLHVSAGADYQYDAAGNMTYNANGTYYTFDQENRLAAAGGYTYLYDADGNRVQKTGGGATTTYWYGSPGIIAESDASGNLTNYIFWNGQRLARNVSGDVKYYITDHLHSTDMFVDKSGAALDDQDYFPWGGAVPSVGTSTSNNHYKFTGKERDSETGLDYFGARYYSNGLGRWISADWSATPVPVPFAHLDNPETLNLYGYVGNNPTSGIDAAGHALRYINGGATWEEVLGGFFSHSSGETTDFASDKLQPQIPLGGSLPPPPPPANAFDQSKINVLTVAQVGGVVFNENHDVQPGESTAEQLEDAKTAQAHAVINADRAFGKNRQKITGTATWKVASKFKSSVQYKEALTAARRAYQEDNIGVDPTGGRVYFNNRFEGDDLKAPRVMNGQSQDVFHKYGPFSVGGGRVWTVIYDDFKN
jgi:RHS repeat-associated protein